MSVFKYNKAFLLILLFSLTLKITVANSEFYKSNLKKNNTYQRLIQDGIPSLITESIISDNAITDTISKDLIIYIVQKSIDPVWLEAVTGKLIDQIALYFSNPDNLGHKVELDLQGSRGFLSQVSGGLTVLEQFVPEQNTNLTQLKKEIEKTRTKINQANLGIINIEKYIGRKKVFSEAGIFFDN